ncbi:hypothetical protein BDV24DRAFT_138654 [Aspergillus arachidicola]|uniref:Uncharacterized protein n=1 Tax=Aspergillus arachidicola TaxID=656916 RepID=A0A5N6Y188_9EURO|nr:hypothetical protein BDV24DRAFT_138654 [Aspergillus arachidicola]
MPCLLVVVILTSPNIKFPLVNHFFSLRALFIHFHFPFLFMFLFPFFFYLYTVIYYMYCILLTTYSDHRLVPSASDSGSI